MDVCGMFQEHDFCTKQTMCFLSCEIQLASLGTTAEIRKGTAISSSNPLIQPLEVFLTLKKSKSTVIQEEFYF